MFELYQFSQTQVLSFILVLIRLSAFVVAMPLVGNEQVAPQIKILFALALTLLIFPLVPWNQTLPKDFENQFIWLAMKEALIGLILGYIGRLFFFVLMIAGEFISLSAGLSSEQLFNPATGGTTTAVTQFQVLIGSLLFLGMDGHHQLIAAVLRSYEVVPLSLEAIQLMSQKEISAFGAEVIWQGLKLAAPVVLSIFFMNLIMGIIGKAVPQVNVLITSLPVNALISFLVILISLPLMIKQMDGLTAMTMEKLFVVLREM